MASLNFSLFPVFLGCIWPSYGLATGDDHLDKSLEILDRGIRATSECTPTISDHLDYYNVLITNTTGSFDNYWIELKDDSKHDRMSTSPGTYELVNLTFGFPFYGHTISQVHLSTAGVMSMVADFHDSPVSHYISPFIGSFNPSHSNDSAIYLEIIDETFIVEWRNVFLRVATGHLGPYQFQTVIDKDGTIFFLYKKIPDDSPHYSTALNSGIYINATGVNSYVEYKGIKILGDDIRDNTVIAFSPKSVCSLAINSTTCNAHNIKFYCKDCEITKNCSNEIYRSTHEWLVHNCKSEIPPVCKTDDGESLTLIIVIAVLAAVIIVILAMLSGWFYYACTRPNSPSGKWLDAHWIGRTKNPSGSTNDDKISPTSKDDTKDPGCNRSQTSRTA